MQCADEAYTPSIITRAGAATRIVAGAWFERTRRVERRGRVKRRAKTGGRRFTGTKCRSRASSSVKRRCCRFTGCGSKRRSCVPTCSSTRGRGEGRVKRRGCASSSVRIKRRCRRSTSAPASIRIKCRSGRPTSAATSVRIKCRSGRPTSAAACLSSK